MQTKLECLTEYLQNLSRDEKLQYHNWYCEQENRFDDQVHDMNSPDLEEFAWGQSYWWFSCRMFYGDFRPNDDLWDLDGYGNLHSFSWYQFENDIFDYEEIANYIYDGYCYEYDQDLIDILNYYDELREWDEIPDEVKEALRFSLFPYKYPDEPQGFAEQLSEEEAREVYDDHGNLSIDSMFEEGLL